MWADQLFERFHIHAIEMPSRIPFHIFCHTLYTKKLSLQNQTYFQIGWAPITDFPYRYNAELCFRSYMYPMVMSVMYFKNFLFFLFLSARYPAWICFFCCSEKLSLILNFILFFIIYDYYLDFNYFNKSQFNSKLTLSRVS